MSKTGSDNSITITPNDANNTKKIKQVILYGAGGINTFNNATVTSANTRKYSDEANNVGALVWENAEGASSATISINSTDRPHIHAITIVTDGAMTWTQQSVALSFDPNSGKASTNLTDFSIDGRVKAKIGGGSPESFRADEFTTSSITNDANSAASFNQFHISTSRVGVNTGASAGTATITATFSGTGNNFYEAATSGTYTLTIQDDSPKTLAISVDDMRISKKVSSNGLNATSGLDRVMGGFEFKFEGGDNVKFNNGDFLIFRNSGGKVTITPQTTGGGTVTITRVDINTLSGYTDGVVEVSGLTGDQTINGVSSYSFANLNSDAGVSSFTMTTKSGNVYVTGFTIYYNGVLNSTKVTPTITLKRGETEISSGTSETVSSSDTYTSPTITGTTPANFDFTITSDNTNVATVAATNWSSSSLVSLQGTEGTATITASAAESTFFNAATSTTYTVTVSSTNSKKWDFTTLDVTNTINETEWEKSGDYYNNKFITTKTTNGAAIASGDAYYTSSNTNSQIYGLLFGRHDSSGLGTGKIRLFSSYLTTNNSAVVIAVPASEGQKVIVTFDGGNGTTQQGFDFTNATLEGDNTATSIKSDETQRIATLTAGTGGYVTLKFTASKVRLYSIEVKDETRKTLTLADINNTYNRATSTTTFSHYVSFTASDGATDALTYEGDESHLNITSSNSSVLDVSHATVSATNFGSGSTFAFEGIEAVGAGTATLTITFDGNNEYKPTSYTSQVYTVSGALGAFAVQADDQAIQQGQRSPIEPIITNNSGQAIGIRGTTGNYETYVLDEEEDVPNYATYFDFTYTPGSGSGTNYDHITVTDGTINTTEDTGIGATRNIAITATVKDEYKSAFSDNVTTANTTMTVTVRAKNAGVNPCTYYWNSNLTSNEVTGPGDDKDYQVETNSSMGVFGQNGTFASGFPNGRMMYVKPNNADDVIFFSYAVNTEPSDFPAQPKYDRDKHIYIYRRGIPIYIDDDFTPGTDYVRVNVATASYDASTKKYTLNSGVVKMKFIMTTHVRPAQPTYDPTSPDSDPTLNKDGRKIMNTSLNVVAYGEGASKGVTGNGNLVYGKFSTSSVYTTAQLINEETVSSRIDNVPVVSTEVNKRRFTAVQIKNYTTGEVGGATGGYGDYISEQTYTEYYYLYDTNLRLTPAESMTSINYNISPNTATPSVPKNTVTWYNKRNYNSSNATGVTQEVDSYDGKISYAITGTYNLTEGTDVSIDAATGIVTSSTTKQGWVKVTVTYAGGEEHGGKSGEPQYVSTTDKSTADFYVYIYDATKERPTITPSTRNFTGQMTYTIKAPDQWDVIYTTDGTDPVVPESGGPDIMHGASTSKTIGAAGEGVIVVDVDDTHVVKAIAYNPIERTSYSAIVSESYTRKAPLPDPVFDPDGVATPYRYNTNTLTVQIACAYAGSEIYYTVDNSTPEIGAATTYKYSGLSKVVISGNVTIKAVAYDPVNKIFSNVVPSVYQYSDKMSKPYFQVSDDGGNTWKGLKTEGATELTEGGTKWYGGENITITPSTQIRIVDPNAVAGTIYYTLDNSTPSADASSLVYTEGYPFTVGKTTTGKAITTLEDAASDVASAEFTIDARFGHVWEAVEQTTPTGIMTKDDGFVISTDENKTVTNTGTHVNARSVTGYAQADITATFGGYDLNNWEKMSIADAAIGEPIGAIGEYSIKSKENAWYELDKNYNHAYMTTLDGRTGTPAPAVHDKTFKVPAKGTYVRFEPEKDGDLTIWVLQQGALLYEDDKYFIDNVLRVRPVYLIDEQGTSYPVKTVNGVPQLWSSARLSENWAKIQAMAAKGEWMDSHRNDNGTMDASETYTQYLRLSDGLLTKTKPTDVGITVVEKLSDVPSDTDTDLSKYYKKVINKGTSAEESANIFRLYQDDLDRNHVNVGDPIKPFPIHTGGTLSLNDGSFIDSSNDGTGYVLASGGYAKYTFEVKAGKTYYFMGVNTKIGIRGFQFVPTESATTTRKTVTITDTSEKYAVDGTEMTPAEAVTAVGNEPVNVTLNRTTAFESGKWTGLVLPFSVSTTQLEKVFGEGTSIIHFRNVTKEGLDYKLHFTKHLHQMLVAGTPVIIKPGKGFTKTNSVTFNGVHLEASAVNPMVDDTYTMMGTLVQENEALHTYDYFVAKSGDIKRWTGSNTAMKATQAWLRPTDGSHAPILTIGNLDNLDDEATGIIDIAIEEANGEQTGYAKGVYDLNGRKVSEGSLNGLPAGVYIVNGKKTVIE